MRATAREISGRGLAVCDYIDVSIIANPNLLTGVWFIDYLAMGLQMLRSPACARELVRVGERMPGIIREIRRD